MAASGANRVVPLERHDASSGTLAEDVAGEWAAIWLQEYINAKYSKAPEQENLPSINRAFGRR